MSQAFIGLGGNLGAVTRQFESAVQRIDQLPGCRLTQRSRLFRTTPIGSRSGHPYFNAAVAIETELHAWDLLDHLQCIEEAAGRRRNVHWGPRILDLDVLACEGVVLHTARLTLPHPHCWYRRFVLDPWIELAPDYLHPELNETIVGLRERLMPRPLPVAVHGFDLEGAIHRRISGITTIAIVDRGDPRVAMTFATGEGPHVGRVFDLSISDDPAALAEQVIRAAIDEPVPLTKPAETWQHIE